MFEEINMDCSYDVTGINAQTGYKEPEDNSDNCMMKNQMLNEIRSLAFAITDIALYLNTHPTDEKALCLHREYCKKHDNLKEKYQRMYGPLSIYFPCNKWKWLDNPWPWERSED